MACVLPPFAVADRVRGHSAFLRSEREKLIEDHVSAGRQRLNSARERRGRLLMLGDTKRQQRQAAAAELKERRRVWDAERKAQRERRGGFLQEEAAAHVAERQVLSRGADARLDAIERAHAEALQEEGVRAAAAIKQRLVEVRQRKLEWGQRIYVQVMEARSAVEEAQQETYARRERAREDLRHASSVWRSRRQRQDDQYMRKAKETRERVLATRQAAKESKEEAFLERRRAASREARASELLQAKARNHRKAELQGRRNEVAEVFQQRFVGRSEEDAWVASPLRKLHRSSARFHDHMLTSPGAAASSRSARGSRRPVPTVHASPGRSARATARV